jgi:hypothetical protein
MSKQALELLNAGKGLSHLTGEEVTKMKEIDLVYIYLMKKPRIIVGSILIFLGILALFIGLGIISDMFGFYNLNQGTKEAALFSSGWLLTLGFLMLMFAFRTKEYIDRIYKIQIKKEEKILEGKN